MTPLGELGSLVDHHEDFLVIDKAPGIGFHRDTGSEGLSGALCRLLGLPRLYPVHRLDRMTSGLLVFAKNLETARELNRQFRQRQVEKYYLALAERKPKKKQGTVSGDMARGRRGGWMLLPSRDNPAVTQFLSVGIEPGLRLFLLRPLTGKTHQLRVMMKSLGSPILGDRRYQGQRAERWDRGYLHAYALAFELRGERFQYRCPPGYGTLFGSDRIGQVLAAWGDPGMLTWPRGGR